MLEFRLLLFSSYVFLARSIFLPKHPSDYIIRIWVFPTLGWKIEFFTNSDFIIWKPKKNRALYLIFSDYRIWTPPKHHFSREKQFELYNSNCISTNSKHICNMHSHFKDNINLPKLSVVLTKKSGFRATWSDCSETFSENHKKNKGSRLP